MPTDFEEVDVLVLFHHPPPPPRPNGLTPGTVMNKFYSSLKISNRCLKFTVLVLGGPPLGLHGDRMYHLDNFEFPTPKDDSCQLLLKSDQSCSRR